MSHNFKNSPSEFAEFLQSTVKLDTLDKITQELCVELDRSHKIMTDLNSFMKTVPIFPENRDMAIKNGVSIEDLKAFEAGLPKLLLPDMDVNTTDVDIDVLIATMKSHAEDLKKNIVIAQPEPIKKEAVPDLNNLNLEQYATSLDHLGKRLANIKLSQTDEIKKIHLGLDGKLGQLCEDVNIFTQMVQAQQAVSLSNNTWEGTEAETTALHYDNIVSKLLTGINEVTYLLQNKN